MPRNERKRAESKRTFELHPVAEVLTLYLMGYRLQDVRYWCVVCASPPRNLDLSRASIVQAVFECQLTLKSRRKRVRKARGSAFADATFRFPLDASSNLRQFANATLDDLERVESVVDRAIQGEAGWDWYRLGHAVGAYRVELYRHFRASKSGERLPQPSEIARAILGIPQYEAKAVPAITGARTFEGPWTLALVGGHDGFFNADAVEGASPDSLDKIVAWHERLVKELREAFPRPEITASSRAQLIRGYLDLQFDENRLMAYRNVAGKEIGVDFLDRPRLWVLLMELSRAAGSRLSPDAIRQLRAENGYANNIELHSIYADLSDLRKAIIPLALKVENQKKKGYCLAPGTARV